jgi:hypothetical protein
MTKKTCHFSMYGHFRELLPIVLEFRGDLQGPWHSVHSFGIPGWFTRPMTLSTFFRGMTKTRRFYILGPFSWDIAHSFGVLEWFTRSMTLSTCLRGMTKNTSFLCFRAVFMSYCQQFWGSVVIYKVHDTQYMSERHDQKLIIFMF